jgi:hypothetical protein
MVRQTMFRTTTRRHPARRAQRSHVDENAVPDVD